MLYTVNGTYGSGFTDTEIFVYQDPDGLSWYVVNGSNNVNATRDAINDGVNVETLNDEACFTWSEPITSEHKLEFALHN